MKAQRGGQICSSNLTLTTMGWVGSVLLVNVRVVCTQCEVLTAIVSAHMKCTALAKLSFTNPVFNARYLHVI